MNANTQPLTAEVDQIIADFLPFFIEMTREEQNRVTREALDRLKPEFARLGATLEFGGSISASEADAITGRRNN